MKKDQYVILCLESPAQADRLLPVARHCAQQLGKGLMVLNVSPTQKATWVQDYGLPYAAMQGRWSTAIAGLPAAFGGVLAVVGVDPSARRSSLAHPQTMLRAFASCQTAYLAVPIGGNSATTTAEPNFTNVALTLDHRRESKEKLVWASYFVRFFGSKLVVASPNYTDQGLRQRWHNNVRFMDKIFASLGITYQSHAMHLSPFDRPDVAAIEQLHPDLLVAMTTDQRDRDVGDWLLGTTEARLLRHPSATSLLLLNQRDDLYVLCD